MRKTHKTSVSGGNSAILLTGDVDLAGGMS